MYVQEKDLNYDFLYQGDLIKDFPFFIFDEDILNGKFGTDNEAKLEVRAKLGLIMILSQTCDIEHRKNVIVCPVYEMRNFSFNKDETESIKERRTGYWFYLPKLENIIDESVADFQTIYYVPRDLLDQNKKNKILTLTDWGRHHLGWALGSYFGRPVKSRD